MAQLSWVHFKNRADIYTSQSELVEPVRHLFQPEWADEPVWHLTSQSELMNRSDIYSSQSELMNQSDI